MKGYFDKHTTAVLDYVIDWTNWLAGDVIVSSIWVVEAGLTQVSDSNTTSTATVWLSGGTDQTEYEVINTVITGYGRTESQCLTINVVLPCED